MAWGISARAALPQLSKLRVSQAPGSILVGSDAKLLCLIPWANTCNLSRVVKALSKGLISLEQTLQRSLFRADKKKKKKR